MGRERTRPRQYFSFCLAFLILVSLSSCAPVQQAWVDLNIYNRTRETRILMEKGDFDAVRKNNEELLEVSGEKRPADVALYNLALVYAHYANPEKDYKKSNTYLERLVQDFPDSPLAEEAKTWATVYGVMEEITTITFAKLEKGAYAGLHFDQSLISTGQFKKAEKKSLQILQHANGMQPADSALYNLGLIHAHYANPEKDYKKATMYFKRLVQDFPQSPLVEEAKTWIGLLDVIEKMHNSVEKMRDVMEEMRQVDIDIEEKKMELTQ